MIEIKVISSRFQTNGSRDGLKSRVWDKSVVLASTRAILTMRQTDFKSNKRSI